MEQLLSFYHWPGNLEELSAVCQRYLYALSMEPSSTVNTRCRLLTNAIGEQALFQSLLLQYPALSPGAAENPGQFKPAWPQPKKFWAMAMLPWQKSWA